MGTPTIIWMAVEASSTTTGRVWNLFIIPTVRVLCDGIDEESGLYLCRTTGDAPEVDGNVCVSSEEPLYPGQFYDVLVEDSDLYDLYGTVAK